MDRNLTLLTDLYQLTMMNGYLRNGKKDDVAVFDLFFRRNNIITYSVAAGLEQAVEYIRSIRFTEDDIAYLRKSPDGGLAIQRFGADKCALDLFLSKYVYPDDCSYLDEISKKFLKK